MPTHLEQGELTAPFTQEEREKAHVQIDEAMMLRTESKVIGALGAVAVNLQCELNRLRAAVPKQIAEIDAARELLSAPLDAWFPNNIFATEGWYEKRTEWLERNAPAKEPNDIERV